VLANKSSEVQAALQNGIPVHGICLYPILNHPGWVDDRHCHNTLWDYRDKHGRRESYAPLAAELRRAEKTFENKLNPTPDEPDRFADTFGSSELAGH
jgi:hypothetical protein